tara:strand:+ start:148 stop:336 length:189 start_codon:yes stop_codon:yes gene_type:complete
MLSRLMSWFSRRIGKLKGHEFGVVRFGPEELPMVPFKHPHIGKVKLFYVDAKVRDRLSEVHE